MDRGGTFLIHFERRTTVKGSIIGFLLMALFSACGDEVIDDDVYPYDSPYYPNEEPDPPSSAVTHLEVIGVGGQEGFTDDHMRLLARETTLKYITITLEGVTDVSGLAGLTGLIKLSLSANNIADIRPLAGLTNLTHLDLSANRITDLSPLAGLTNLTHLNLAGTRIADLRPLAELSNLMVVDLSRNEITDLSPLAGLANLEVLDLSNNYITALPSLAGMKSLRILFLPDNKISDIDGLAPVATLIILDLQLNRIVDITPLKGLTRIQKLFLSHNRIVDLAPLVANPGLVNKNPVDGEYRFWDEAFIESDVVAIRDNLLSDVSLNQHIPALEARGVIVDQVELGQLWDPNQCFGCEWWYW